MTTGPSLIEVFVAALVMSWALGWGVYPLLFRAGIIDKPNVRSSHSHPTVRGGGLPIVLTVLIGIGYLLFGREWRLAGSVIGLGLLLAGVSFFDDIRPLGAFQRFSVHAVVALGALAALWNPNLLWPPSPAAVFAAALGFLWITGYTNAFNFMDGINGIAATQALVTGLGSALVIHAAGSPAPISPASILFVLIAGAAAGFLPHNFPKARMFMGDVGSAPLGYFLAVAVLWEGKDIGAWVLIPLGLIHANFILDTGFTLGRRVLRGEAWYKPHREHFYQRLLRSGKTHTYITGWETALQITVVALMLSYVRISEPGFRLILVFLVFAIWFVFFFYCETRFSRSLAGLAQTHAPHPQETSAKSA